MVLLPLWELQMDACEIRGGHFPRAIEGPVWGLKSWSRAETVRERLVEHLGHVCRGGCIIWQSNIGAGREP